MLRSFHNTSAWDQHQFRVLRNHVTLLILFNGFHVAITGIASSFQNLLQRPPRRRNSTDQHQTYQTKKGIGLSLSASLVHISHGVTPGMAAETSNAHSSVVQLICIN